MAIPIILETAGRQPLLKLRDDLHWADPSTLEEGYAQKGPALIAVPVDYAENMKLTERLGDVSIPM